VPAFNGMSWAKIGDLGVQLESSTQSAPSITS
jgi:hypothetical protein